MTEIVTEMPWLSTKRDVVQVSGVDAAKYLNTQLSQDLSKLAEGAATWSLLLQPTGKVEALVRVRRTADDRFELDTDPGFGEVVAARLRRFLIRTRAEIVTHPADAADDGDEAARIAARWPRMGAEIVPGETIPAELGILDLVVSFTKGCYPGQELVERMDSRSAAARRTLVALDVAGHVRPGDVIDHDGHAATVTSVAGGRALAYVGRGSSAQR